MSLLLSATGCGQDAPSAGEGSTALSVMAAGPRWRGKSAGGTASGLTFQARTPTRVRVRMQGRQLASDTGSWRTLVSGQTVDVLWSYVPAPAGTIQDKPTPEERERGHTAPLGTQISAYFGDGGADFRRLVFWARPGSARLLHANAVPPGRYEDLPTEGSIELLAVALLDYAGGGGQWKRREQGLHLLLPKSQLPGDRHDLVRVFLDFEPAGP